MKNFFPLLMVVVILLGGCTSYTEWNTDTFSLRLGDDGAVVGMVDRINGVDYLAEGIVSPLLSLRIDGALLAPLSAEFDTASESITLTYPGHLQASVSVRTSASFIRFEVTDVSPRAGVELVVWGPYPTVLDDIIGETVGVVQGEDYAIGLQALNPKTLGGFPWNENDALPQLDIFESGDYGDLDPAGKRGVLYRVEAAKPEKFGSALQAYTRERNTDRIVANRGYDAYLAPAYDDGGIVGSSIALFGSRAGEALSTIGEIELAEGLAHPMIDGKWGKISKGASAAYLIMGFGEKDIDRALEITRRAGLRYLYHSDPFDTWGHFELKKSYFPRGIESMKAIVQRAKEHEIMLGVHMLSNFITPNDPYVTPVPDGRLARVGSTTLVENVDATTGSIPIESPRYFNQEQKSHLRASVIEDEIIQCTGITNTEPWRLLGCDRGAFGTSATAHSNGVEVGKLDDHAYNVFLSNTDLSIEIAENVARLFNEAGLQQISFDGLEGNRSTGMGNYGEILFTQAWFDALDESVRRHYIADASRTSHFFWHMYTRMNWGEPWYAGFRESQTEYRLKNQAYFKRNLMPGMLGWFSMRPETSVEDIEWMLARSAGFDAGYGFVTGYDHIDKNGQSDEILTLLGIWEAARMADAFSDEQKKAMQDIKNEFHLVAVDATSWDLYPVTSLKFSHSAQEKQPGEPTFSTFSFTSEPDETTIEFILTAVGATASNIVIEIDNKRNYSVPVSLQDGDHLKYTGGNTVILYSSTWQAIRELPIPTETFSLGSGDHVVRFDAVTPRGSETEVKFEIRLVGAAERIRVD